MQQKEFIFLLRFWYLIHSYTIRLWLGHHGAHIPMGETNERWELGQSPWGHAGHRGDLFWVEQGGAGLIAARRGGACRA